MKMTRKSVFLISPEGLSRISGKEDELAALCRLCEMTGLQMTRFLRNLEELATGEPLSPLKLLRAAGGNQRFESQTKQDKAVDRVATALEMFGCVVNVEETGPGLGAIVAAQKHDTIAFKWVDSDGEPVGFGAILGDHERIGENAKFAFLAELTEQHGYPAAAANPDASKGYNYGYTLEFTCDPGAVKKTSEIIVSRLSNSLDKPLAALAPSRALDLAAKPVPTLVSSLSDFNNKEGTTHTRSLRCDSERSEDKASKGTKSGPGAGPSLSRTGAGPRGGSSLVVPAASAEVGHTLGLRRENRLSPADATDVFRRLASQIDLPPPRKFSASRQAAFAALLKAIPEAAYPDFWERLAETILDSPFLMGASDRGWRPSVIWLLKPENMTKVVEGNYSYKPPPFRVQPRKLSEAEIHRIQFKQQYGYDPITEAPQLKGGNPFAAD